MVIPEGEQSKSLDVSLYKVNGETSNHARGDMATDYRSAAENAQVIWTEGMELTPSLNWSGNQCTMTVSKASADNTGNALVGLYDGENGTGNLLWSFHVWAPQGDDLIATSGLPDGFSKAYKLSLGQVTGATDTYIYYQWGRKDPLGRGSTAHTTIVLGPVELDVARMNPTVFYRIDSPTPRDWISPQDGNLWNTSFSTVYDPCPEGYHVPSTALWDGIGAGTTPSYSGLTYASGGCRTLSDGLVSEVGNYGYYWSGSNGTSGFYLEFNYKKAYPAHSHQRAMGFGVRCVQN